MPLAEVTTFDVQAILSLLVYTGLRVSELVDLRLRDVEINARSGKVCVYGKGRGSGRPLPRYSLRSRNSKGSTLPPVAPPCFRFAP